MTFKKIYMSFEMIMNIRYCFHHIKFIESSIFFIKSCSKVVDTREIFLLDLKIKLVENYHSLYSLCCSRDK